MAIITTNSQRTSEDVFGNISTEYKGNAGDHTIYTFDVAENIFHRSNDLFPIRSTFVLRGENKVVFPNYWTLNGFAVGQAVTLTCTVPNGGTTFTEPVNTTIVSIDYSTLVVEFANFFLNSKCKLDTYDDISRLDVYSADLRKELNLSFNFTNNLAPSSETGNIVSITDGGYLAQVAPYRASQIDGNRTYLSGDISTIGVGASINLVQQGKKSGSFAITARITRTADAVLFHNYTVVLEFINIGCVFPDLTAFNHSGIYFDFEWYSTTDGSHPSVNLWNYNPSESGWFGEGYLTEQPNSFLTQTVTDPIYYNAETTHTVIIDSVSPDIATGACYISTDDDYYLDKNDTQSDLLMYLESFGALSTGFYLSTPNLDGAQYQIEIVSVVNNPGVDFTVNFKFSNVNQQFIDFIEGRNILDRKINIWFTVGNVNHLVFSDNLLKEPKPTFPLVNYQPAAATEFARFQTDSTLKSYGAEGVLIDLCYASIADNLNLKIFAALPKFKLYSRLTMQVVGAERLDNSNYFVLESMVMDLTQQVYNPIDGITQMDITQQRSNNLPSTSPFNVASLGRFSPYPDEVNRFQISLLFPFLIDWKYWINQDGIPALFYPNQNRNYINYDTATYGIYVRFLLETEEFDIQHFAPIEDIHDFNETFPVTDGEEWQGSAIIEYFDPQGDPQSILVENSIMTVKVTVTTVQTLPIPAGEFWGEMSIEPNESSPRWTTSTNYDNDGNSNNPFIALTGETKLFPTRVDATHATFQTQINTSGLSVGDYNITMKFMSLAAVVEQVRLEFPTEVSLPAAPQFTVDPTDECCDKFRIFSSLTEIGISRNNETSAWYKLLGVGDSVLIEIYDANGNLATFQPPLLVVPNTPTARFITFNWRSVLSTDGEGCYEIRITYTDQFANVTVTVWGVYDLMDWNELNTDGYVGFNSYFNSNQIIDGIDFTGLFAGDSINVKGQFGDRNPATEINNIIRNNRIVEKVTEENINEYSFVSDPITSIFTDRLLDLHFLSANRMNVTDYNKFNHKKYTEKEIVIREVKEPKYLNPSNKAVITAAFGDRRLNQKSQYGI